MKKLKFQNPTQYEWERILDIRYDAVFKAVFTKETAESRAALSDLVSALIGRAVSVETIIANEPSIDDLRQRHLRFDIACKTEKGEYVNIEMSFNPMASEPVRLEYHAARLFVGQGIHGKDKTYDDLKETYQITILAQQRFFPDEYLTHDFLYYDPQKQTLFGGRTKIITVELEKTEPIAGKPVEEMTTVELWAVFFQYLTDKEKRDKIMEIINQEEGIAMALDTLVNITQDEVEYARMSNLIKSQLDWQSGMIGAERKGLAEGREEGFIEGLAEGLNKASLDIARNLKRMGLPISQIADGTGLPIETIAQL